MDVKNVVECEMAENKPALNVEWLGLDWIFSATEGSITDAAEMLML